MTSLDIFIPYYGGIDFLKIAVNSVINQSNPNWRLIIVDDDFPGKEAVEFTKSISDSRVLYVRNKQNLGIGKNFKKCFEMAESPYVTIMGSDDQLMNNYVERVLFLISISNSPAYIQPVVEVIDAGGNEFKPLTDRIKQLIKPNYKGPKHLSGDKLLSSLMMGNWTYFPSIAWNSNMVKKIDFQTNMSITADLDLQAKLILQGFEMFLDSGKPIFKYRRHSKSESMKPSSALERFLQERELMTWISNEAQKRGLIRSQLLARLRLTSRINTILVALSLAIRGDYVRSIKLFEIAFS